MYQTSHFGYGMKHYALCHLMCENTTWLQQASFWKYWEVIVVNPFPCNYMERDWHRTVVSAKAFQETCTNKRPSTILTQVDPDLSIIKFRASHLHVQGVNSSCTGLLLQHVSFSGLTKLRVIFPDGADPL